MVTFCKGVLLVVTFIVMEQLDLGTSRAYDCQFVDRLYDFIIEKNDAEVIKKASRQAYKYDCWGSQLTDKSRYALYDFFVAYRGKIAQGTCSFCQKNNLPKYANVFRMHYHWIMEFVAASVKLKDDQTKILSTTEKRKIFEVIDTFAYNRGSFTDYDLYTYVVYRKSLVIGLITSSPNDAIYDYMQRLGVPPEGDVYDWGNKNIFRFMYPTSTYFGCHLRYKETVINNETVVDSALTFAFATKNAGKGPRIVEGPISEESCNKAEPKGVLTASSYGTLLCVDAKYETSDHEYDMPCQFSYPVTHQSFGASRTCTDGSEPKGYKSLEMPSSAFDHIRIRRGDNDSIFLPDDEYASPDTLCRLGIMRTPLLLVPRYTIKCYSPFVLFLICCAFFVILLVVLIISNYANGDH